MPSTRRCLLLDLGIVEYGQAFELQRALAAGRESGALPDTLVLLQHLPVLTLGRRASGSNIVVAEELLRREGVAVERSTRGGDVTYHGPGQIVGYPILNLRALGLGAAAYVHGLEASLIDLLGKFGIRAGTDPKYIGVWVGAEKIAAIGVAITHGISMHGFALNVDPNLGHFSLINPCGITDRGVTSMTKLIRRPVSIDEVRPLLLESLSRTFDLEIERAEPDWLARMGIPVPALPQAI